MGYAAECVGQIGLFAEQQGLQAMTPVYRLKLVRDGGVAYCVEKVSRSNEVYELLKKRGLADEAQEVLVCLYLSTKNEVVGLNEVSRGTLNASLFHPREVLKGAILANANSIIVAHNHPSGDPEPSNADKQVTARLKEVCELVQIELLDHIVVGHDRWYSFGEHGML